MSLTVVFQSNLHLSLKNNIFRFNDVSSFCYFSKTYKPWLVLLSIQVQANKYVKLTSSNSYFKITQPNLGADKILALIWRVESWWWPVVAVSLPSRVQMHANMAACGTTDQSPNERQLNMHKHTRVCLKKYVWSYIRAYARGFTVNQSLQYYTDRENDNRSLSRL